jgi:hypothetical protein
MNNGGRGVIRGSVICDSWKKNRIGASSGDVALLYLASLYGEGETQEPTCDGGLWGSGKKGRKSRFLASLGMTIGFLWVGERVAGSGPYEPAGMPALLNLPIGIE